MNHHADPVALHQHADKIFATSLKQQKESHEAMKVASSHSTLPLIALVLVVGAFLLGFGLGLPGVVWGALIAFGPVFALIVLLSRKARDLAYLSGFSAGAHHEIALWNGAMKRAVPLDVNFKHVEHSN